MKQFKEGDRVFIKAVVTCDGREKGDHLYVCMRDAHGHNAMVHADPGRVYAKIPRPLAPFLPAWRARLCELQARVVDLLGDGEAERSVAEDMLRLADCIREEEG